MATRKPLLGAGWRSAALATLALAIVACSHHHNNSTTTNTTNNVVAAQPLVDSFGTGFGTDFQASPNAQPANVTTSDVNPTDPTAQPTSLNNIGG